MQNVTYLKRMASHFAFSFVVLYFFVSTSGLIHAHSGGPPYVKIDAVYAQTNPVINSLQPTSISVGLDIASSSGYIVQTPISFEVDTKLFPNPYAQAQNPFGLPTTNQQEAQPPEFRWDFKDGSAKRDGHLVSHTYKKSGTYIVELEAKYPGKTADFSQVNTIQISILPHEGYMQPKAVIRIDSQEIEDPLQDAATVRSGSFISFDAGGSTGKIVKYEWDFGDEKGSDKQIDRHRYARDQYFPTVVLRVVDDIGVINDTYALVNLPFEKSNFLSSIYYTIIDFFYGLLDSNSR